MKLLVWILLCSLPAHASTQILFARDGQKATILLLGLTSNPDGQKLYDALNVAPQEQQGKLTKHVGLTTSDGQKTAELICAFSKLSPGTGSCTVTINAVRGTELNPGARRAVVKAEGADAVLFAKAFQPSASGEIYRTSDDHLKITASGEGTSAVFTLAYD